MFEQGDDQVIADAAAATPDRLPRAVRPLGRRVFVVEVVPLAVKHPPDSSVGDTGRWRMAHPADDNYGILRGAIVTLAG